MEFKRDHWDTIDKNDEMKILPFLDLNERPLTFQQSLKHEVVTELLKILGSQKDQLPRDDYREMLELCLVMLGVTPPRGLHVLRPGATHHARWMAVPIYTPMAR